MKQQQFEAQFSPLWQQFDQTLRQLEGEALEEATQARGDFAADYRRLCHHLSLARERQYSSQLVERLNALVLRGHQQLYHRKTELLASFLRFVVGDFPRLVRREWRLCLLASALLYLPGLLLFVSVWRYPELIYAMLDPYRVAQFESMYDPAAEHVGRLRDAGSDLSMFGFYIQNNIGVSFRTFAGGLLYGLGSIFFLAYNGALFGALAAHLLAMDYHTTFFPFVVGHGAFELTAIAFSGAAGLKLGWALLAPGRQPRLVALKAAARVAIKLMYGVILMLVMAAFVEAFWSSSALVAPWGKYLVGATLWAFVLLYFVRMGRGGYGS